MLKRFPPPAFFTAWIDGASVPAKAELMEALASAFRFPAYFGRNWDALLDCLRSLPEELPAPGYVLAVRNSASFLSASPKDLEDFADIAGEARSFLLERHKIAFTVVLL
ncbi:MAG: barstar family protein [Elusimicrobiales bacterium]